MSAIVRTLNEGRPGVHVESCKLAYYKDPILATSSKQSRVAALMKDRSLTPAERQQRIQAVMQGEDKPAAGARVAGAQGGSGEGGEEGVGALGPSVGIVDNAAEFWAMVEWAKRQSERDAGSVAFQVALIPASVSSDEAVADLIFQSPVFPRQLSSTKRLVHELTARSGLRRTATLLRSASSRLRGEPAAAADPPAAAGPGLALGADPSVADLLLDKGKVLLLCLITLAIPILNIHSAATRSWADNASLRVGSTCVNADPWSQTGTLGSVTKAYLGCSCHSLPRAGACPDAIADVQVGCVAEEALRGQAFATFGEIVTFGKARGHGHVAVSLSDDQGVYE